MLSKLELSVVWTDKFLPPAAERMPTPMGSFQ